MTHAMKRVRRHVMSTLLTLSGLAGAVASPVQAQLPSVSAVDLGLGGAPVSEVVDARAIAVNPAGLATSSGFSFSLLPVTGATGLAPVKLSELGDYGGAVIPLSIREDWVSRVEADGSLSGDVNVGVSGFALSAGRFGLQFSTTVSGSLGLSPDAVELMLFGNAGRAGTAVDLDLDGSEMNGFALSTLAFSYGHPVADGVSLGVTAKYHIGHALLIGRDRGSQALTDPLSVSLDLPSVLTSVDASSMDGGTGIGLDLGARIERGDWVLAGSARNLINTFAWDDAALAFRPGTGLFDGTTFEVEFDETPVEQAPAFLQDLVDEAVLNPELAFGATWTGIERLRLVGNLERRFGDGLSYGPDFSLTLGADYALLPWLGVRGHAGAITDGVQFGGGASLALGPVRLSSAVAIRQGDTFEQTVGGFSLSFGMN